MVVLVPVPGLRPGDVAVGVVLEFEGGCLCVCLCFEEGASGLRALRERGGEEGGERVREEGVHFGGVQYWLGPRTNNDTFSFLLLVEERKEGGMNADREGVVKDEYDYAVRVIGDEARCERGEVEIRTALRVLRFRRERDRGCRGGAVCACPAEDRSVRCQRKQPAQRKVEK